ncbi:DNA repair protein RecO [Olsenella sp. oral taxon 809 str. F0356]|nr:DNA repair protein RecO [Olsenella sp. oral taxon 809 str. F0356]
MLARTKLSEQDLILTILGESGAQLRAVAKGARKPGGRLASRSELFCETDFLMARGRSLDVVSEAVTVDAHPGIRGDYARLCAASAVAEVARLSSFEESEDPYLFRICSAALGSCERASGQPHLDLLVAAYAFKVLAHEGWMPELDSCIACGDPDVTHFSPVAGGALCASCARGVAGAQELSHSEFQWLRALLGSTFGELMGAEADERAATELLSIAHAWAATHLDARLRALEFMFSM